MDEQYIVAIPGTGKTNYVQEPRGLAIFLRAKFGRTETRERAQRFTREEAQRVAEEYSAEPGHSKAEIEAVD